MRNAARGGVELDYLYEAETGDQLAGTVGYGAISEGVAGVLEKEEFRLLETGGRAGEHVLRGLLAIREATVLVTKLQVPVARLISKVMVEATFRQ